MYKKVFLENINLWEKWAKETDCYDVALLKMWIQLDNFMTTIFIDYCLGNPSEDNYQPQRSLLFSSEEQLNAFLKKDGCKFIDYQSRIATLHKYIFTKSPFELIFTDVNYKDTLDKLYIIRNYVAHESATSKDKYVKAFFGGDNTKFVEINKFLKKQNKSTGCSNFSYFVDKIREVVKILTNPPNF